MTQPPSLANPVYRGETCRACRREIVFILTPKGRREPLERQEKPLYAWRDADVPDSALRVVAIVNGQPQSLGLTVAENLGVDLVARAEVGFHVAHFATCPDRDRFRRRAR